MGFKSTLGSSADGVPSKDMKVGDMIEGYLTGIKESDNKNYPGTKNVTLFIQTDDDKRLAVFASGNLKFAEEQLEKHGAPMGSRVRIIRADIPKGTKYKSYFDLQFNSEDVIDLASLGSEDDTEF